VDRAKTFDQDVVLMDLHMPQMGGVSAVRVAARGGTVLAPSVAAQLVGLAADGASNQQAARRLFISEATVRTHLLHTYATLGVDGRAAVIASAGTWIARLARQPLATARSTSILAARRAGSSEATTPSSAVARTAAPRWRNGMV
jgi:chemotaxis response regulator CheB